MRKDDASIPPSSSIVVFLDSSGILSIHEAASGAGIGSDCWSSFGLRFLGGERESECHSTSRVILLATCMRLGELELSYLHTHPWMEEGRRQGYNTLTGVRRRRGRKKNTMTVSFSLWRFPYLVATWLIPICAHNSMLKDECCSSSFPLSLSEFL